MAIELTGARSAHVIVVGNEKGGSGKSTVAMNIAIALMKQGHRVASVDIDTRQRSFTNYVENRRAWAEQIAHALEVPDHVCLDEHVESAAADDRDAASVALAGALDRLAENHDFIVVDTAGHDSHLTRLAHAMADTLITPLNDSFVDFDVLGTGDPATFGVTGTSHYARMVEEARGQRRLLDQVNIDWIMLRNRLSMTNSRNKLLVDEGLQGVAQRLDFRYFDGLAERLIFREFYPRGLTAMDDLDARTLGTRPTLSHATARMEVEGVLAAMGLGTAAGEDPLVEESRNAA